jgi:CheY-like chemotaxis protein
MRSGPAARSRIAAALETSGYVIAEVCQGEEQQRLLHAPPCVILMDLSHGEQSNARTLAAARAAQVFGIPIVTVSSFASAVPGVLMALPLRCDGEALSAAVEVACYGHGHSRPAVLHQNT